MSLPKEPRQKMINMMYLVLTALLALNVSAEILNAFKTVNNSLNTSNEVLNTSTDKVFTAFADYKKDAKNAENANIWEPKALKVKQYSKTVSDRIDSLKLRLMRESGYDPANGDTTFNVDNL